MSTATCPSCGAGYEIGAAFCEACGADLAGVGPRGPVPAGPDRMTGTAPDGCRDRARRVGRPNRDRARALRRAGRSDRDRARRARGAGSDGMARALRAGRHDRDRAGPALAGLRLSRALRAGRSDRDLAQ